MENFKEQNVRPFSVNEIKHKAIKSIKWSFLVELVPKAIVPITTLVFVRILSPADFGIMAIATIFIGFAAMFQDFGLAKALIREKKNVKDSANVVFWSNLTFSVIVYFFIFIIAPFAAIFFKEPKLNAILRVLCLEIVISSLISVQYAILQKEFQFKKIFLGGMGFVIVPIAVTIPLAIYGFGVWALVFGSLASYAIQAIILWVLSGWRPELKFSFSVAKRLFNFGAWFTAESFMLWLLSYGDSATVGYFLNINDVGIYSIGLTLTSLVFGTIFNPLLSVAYSSFSAVRDDLDYLRDSFVKVSEILAVLCIPIGIGLILTAHPIYSIFFKSSWSGIYPVIALLGAMQMLSWLVGMNPTIYRTIGRPDINFKIGIFSMFFYLPFYVFFAQFGLVAFCVGRLLVAIITDGIHLFVLHKTLKVSPAYLLKCVKTPIVAAIPMSVIVYVLIYFSGSFLGWSGALKLVLIVMAGAGAYVGVLRLIDKNRFNKSFSLFVKTIK